MRVFTRRGRLAVPRRHVVMILFQIRTGREDVFVEVRASREGFGGGTYRGEDHAGDGLGLCLVEPRAPELARHLERVQVHHRGGWRKGRRLAGGRGDASDAVEVELDAEEAFARVRCSAARVPRASGAASSIPRLMSSASCWACSVALEDSRREGVAAGGRVVQRATAGGAKRASREARSARSAPRDDARRMDMLGGRARERSLK